jgi:cytochrome c556
MVLGGLAAVALAGCARSMHQGAMPGSGDVVADRQRLMKLQGASMRDINGKIQAGNIEAVAVNAETLSLTAEHIPSLFPKGPIPEKSNAKPEIWQNQAKFDGYAKTLQTMAGELRAAAAAKDAAKTQAVAREIGQKACGACHTDFRKPLRT